MIDLREKINFCKSSLSKISFKIRNFKDIIDNVIHNPPILLPQSYEIEEGEQSESNFNPHDT